MTKFLKITSVSKTSIEDLFTLGVSTSRGHEDKIGQFGSGTLLGTLAWMRSHDKTAPLFSVNGRLVEFRCVERTKGDGEKFDQVLINGTPAGVCLEYGIKDWPTPELGLREWISNAIDAGQHFDLILSVVSEPAANVDEVAVFVPYNDIAKEYHKNLGQYFLFGKYSHTSLMNDFHIQKEKPSKCRIFRRGVFVRELEKESLCDYNFAHMSITECRTASSDAIESNIGYHCWYNRCEELGKKIVEAVVSGKKYVETIEPYANCVAYTYSGLKSAIDELVGKWGFSTLSFPMANTTIIPEGWYQVFVKTAPDLDGLRGICAAERLKMKIVPTPEWIERFYDLCFETMRNLEVSSVAYENAKRTKPKLVCCEHQDGSTNGFYKGLYSRLNIVPEISIRVDEDFMSDGETKTIIIHELCHHFSNGADDGSALFEKVAHEIIRGLFEVLA